MTGKRKIYFRADAGKEIGYGHFIRSLALADMLKGDFDCTFFTQTPSDYQLREAKDICPIVALPNDATKFEAFLEQLQGDEIVVLDNYFFTTEYQRAIKAKGCKLVCIDDMHNKHYVADVVINHGVDDLSLFDTEKYTRLCLGINYVLLRKPFLESSTVIRRRKGMAVVCFGGADPENLTKRYTEQLMKCQWIKQVDAVVGDGYQFKADLEKMEKVNVHSCLSAEEMANLFHSAEIVVCSASTTCLEALACGAKVFAGWYVENQKEFYESCSVAGYITPLGRLTDQTDIPIPLRQTKEIRFPDVVNNINTIFANI